MINENVILDRMAQTVVPDESLLQRFDIDFRWIVPHWVQVTERKDVPGYVDMWGVPYKAAGDWDHCVVDGAPVRQATRAEQLMSSNGRIRMTRSNSEVFATKRSIFTKIPTT